MMIPVKLSELEVYHGQRVVSNKFYIEHFKKQGKDIEHFLRDVIGRDKRYMVDPERENSLTMAIEVSRRILAKTGLTGSDFDMIVFSCVVPEYAVPPCSIHLHEAIGGGSENIALLFRY